MELKVGMPYDGVFKRLFQKYTDHLKGFNISFVRTDSLADLDADFDVSALRFSLKRHAYLFINSPMEFSNPSTKKHDAIISLFQINEISEISDYMAAFKVYNRHYFFPYFLSVIFITFYVNFFTNSFFDSTWNVIECIFNGAYLKTIRNKFFYYIIFFYFANLFNEIIFFGSIKTESMLRLNRTPIKTYDDFMNPKNSHIKPMVSPHLYRGFIENSGVESYRPLVNRMKNYKNNSCYVEFGNMLVESKELDSFLSGGASYISFSNHGNLLKNYFCNEKKLKKNEIVWLSTLNEAMILGYAMNKSMNVYKMNKLNAVFRMALEIGIQEIVDDKFFNELIGIKKNSGYCMVKQFDYIPATSKVISISIYSYKVFFSIARIVYCTAIVFFFLELLTNIKI